LALFELPKCKRWAIIPILKAVSHLSRRSPNRRAKPIMGTTWKSSLPGSDSFQWLPRIVMARARPSP
jgi:hypothetical protein